MRDEFLRDTGDFGEGKFLRLAGGKWRVRYNRECNAAPHGRLGGWLIRQGM